MNLLPGALCCEYEMMYISVREEKTVIIRLTVLCSTVQNVTWDLCTPKINEMQQHPVTFDAAREYGNMEIHEGWNFNFGNVL